MGAAEAKEKALGILSMWLFGNNIEIDSLTTSLSRKRARIHKIASANVKNVFLRNFLKFLNAILSNLVKWTVRRLERAQVHTSELDDAMSELADNSPDKAIELLAEGMLHTSSDDTSLDLGSSFGVTYFFTSIIHGLHKMNNAA